MLEVIVNLGVPYQGTLAWDDDYFEVDESWKDEREFKSLDDVRSVIGKEYHIWMIEQQGKKVIVWIY